MLIAIYLEKVNTVKKIKTICLILITLLTLTACGGDKWQESYDLGMHYLSEGNYAEAIIAFDKAIKIDPKQPMAYVGRADAHIASGETDDNLAVAFVDYTAALELDETNANAWLGLADVYIRQGEFGKARETLQEALVKTNNADIIADKLAEIEAGNIVDSSGNIRRMNGYDENGNLAWYHIYSYDEKGKRSAVTSYDSQNQQTGHVDIEYDSETRRSVGYHWLRDTGKIGKMEWFFDENGNEIKCVMDNGNELYYEYDEQGNKIKETQYYKGQLDAHKEFEWSNGNLIKEYHYAPHIDNYYAIVINEYDDNNNKIKQSSYDQNNQLQWYTLYSYDENGKMIGEKHYNGDGTLRASTASE